MPRVTISAIGPERKELYTLDEEGSQWVAIRPPAWPEEMARGDLLKSRSVSLDELGFPVTRVEVNLRYLWPEEIWLTYDEADIDVEIEKPDGTSVVVAINKPRDQYTRREFMNLLVQLPSNVITEWHAYVLQVVPAWQYPF